MGLIREARDRNVHVVLGYPSWPAYVVAEFGGTMGRLKTMERKGFALQLAGLGLSTRAIAAVMGSSKSTVGRDIDRPSVPDGPDGDGTVMGLDGRKRPRRGHAPPNQDFGHHYDSVVMFW